MRSISVVVCRPKTMERGRVLRAISPCEERPTYSVYSPLVSKLYLLKQASSLIFLLDTVRRASSRRPGGIDCFAMITIYSIQFPSLRLREGLESGVVIYTYNLWGSCPLWQPSSSRRKSYTIDECKNDGEATNSKPGRRNDFAFSQLGHMICHIGQAGTAGGRLM